MTTARIPRPELEPEGAPDTPPVVVALRAGVADLIDDAHAAASQMRGADVEPYRVGQAERAIALFEAAHRVRDVLDVALDEAPST